MHPQLTSPARSPLGEFVRCDVRRVSRRPSAAERRAIRCGIAVSLIWLASFSIGFKSSLAIVMIAGFAMSLVGLRRPLYGVIGIGLLCSLDSMSRVFLLTGGLFRYNTFNYWLLGVMALTLPVLLRQNDIQTWLLRLFIGLLIAELAWTPGMEQGILSILNVVTVFGLFVYFYRCREDPRMWYVLALTVGLSSTMAGLVFLLNNEGLSYVTVREELRIKDIYDRNYIDANAYCYTFLTSMFSISVALANRPSKREQAILYILFAVNFCWVLLAGSRGGILVGAACAIFLLGLLRSNSRRLKFLTAIALGTVVVVNSFPQMVDRSVHRVNKLFDEKYTAAQRTSARSDHYVGAWQLFLQNPLGVGTGGYKKSWAELRLNDLRSTQAGQEKAAHSAWLKTMVENGVPGIILLVMFVVSFAYVGLQQRRTEGLRFGILVTTILTCAFVSTEFWSKTIWFVVAASMVYLRHHVEFPPAFPRPLPPLKGNHPRIRPDHS